MDKFGVKQSKVCTLYLLLFGKILLNVWYYGYFMGCFGDSDLKFITLFWDS
ncbi:hypothetical protein [Campylobacter majalis]|uniref:hypothetical protein n=1 Tax=Campylobacter majalis TaxID=2790656 RepID=UPI001E3212FB|nr:hypothetical protein [Campylobacter majalis]